MERGWSDGSRYQLDLITAVFFMLRPGQGILQTMAGKDAEQVVGQDATKCTGTADRMAGAIEDGGGAIGDGLPQWHCVIRLRPFGGYVASEVGRKPNSPVRPVSP
jgi:hypothetical protein